MTEAIATAEREFGVARVLVNCAGIAYGAKTVGSILVNRMKVAGS